MSFTQAYLEGFQRHYPQTKVKLQPCKVKIGREVKFGYFVVINGDKGNRGLTVDELVSATKDFNR